MLCYCIGWIKIALNETNSVDDLVVVLFPETIHNFMQGETRDIHKVLSQRLLVDVKNCGKLFLKKLKHNFTLIAETFQCHIHRK